MLGSRMRKKTAGLGEMFRLYLFTRSLPDIVSVLEQLSQPSAGADEDGSNEDMHKTVLEKFLNPLRQMSGKFSMYEKLIEHVVDFSQLPDFRVNAQHDEELQELAVEQKGLEQRAEKIWNDARMSYASFAEVKLEKNNQHGFILRTTRGEDERQLREKNAQVKILSILKNGTHFTTPALERIAERFQAIDQEYEEKQEAIVSKALETAMTYLPLVESVATLISELDVLQAFATAASFAPGQYVRPQLLAKGSGVIKIEVSKQSLLRSILF